MHHESLAGYKMAAGSDTGSRMRAGELPRRGNEKSEKCVRKKTEMFADRKEISPFTPPQKYLVWTTYTATSQKPFFFLSLFHVVNGVIDCEQKKKNLFR